MIVPMVGKVYQGRSGPLRRVTGINFYDGNGWQVTVGSAPNARLWQAYDVRYEGLTQRGWGKERQCWCSTWEAWATAEKEQETLP